MVTGRLSDVIHPALVILGATAVLVGVFYSFSTVTTLTAVGLLVIYIMFYRVCMFATNAPLTNLNARILGMEQIRMGQGLMGVVRNIGASLGVTVTSVVFERRRGSHQLMAYQLYDDASPAHINLMDDLKHTLHQAGVVGATSDQAQLGEVAHELTRWISIGG